MIESHIPNEADWIQNTDFSFPFTIFQADDVTPLDITGYTLSWTLRRRASDVDPPIMAVKTTGNGGILITGVYNVNPVTNTQRAVVIIDDLDTAVVSAGLYYHELKRTDAGSETVLSQGRAVLKAASHH